MKSLLVSIALILLFAQCEKVVDIPLNEADQKIVVEAVGKNLTGESYILLSKTVASSASSESIPFLSGASVMISDQSGNEFIFEESPMEQGRYEHPTFVGVSNTVYDLSVLYEGEMLNATTRSITPPQIDSLFVFQSTEDFAGNPDTSNILIYTVTDNPDEKNYYRFVLWVNGIPDNDIFIETDDLGNGATYTSPFFGIDFESGDEVKAELWSMTKQSYDYFFGLASAQDQGPFSAAPADPPTNIEDGIGYFGVFMTDTMSITIP